MAFRLFTLVSLAYFSLNISVAFAECRGAREYVTTLEFLRDKKAFEISEAEARKLAITVAEGCDGAAQRFIRVSLLLSKSGLTARDAIKTGLEFAKKSETETVTFSEVFKEAFLPEKLDLDLRDSIHLATSLTHAFEGDKKRVLGDFKRLLTYCTEAKNLDLPRSDCGIFAARVASLGQYWNGGIAQAFIDTFEFIRSNEVEHGPSLITGQALKLAESVVSSGPGATENFITAYKYASARQGMDLPRAQALSFAQNMAKLPDRAIASTPSKRK